jgi:phosphoglycerate dehydrogenase-like enzyme
MDKLTLLILHRFGTKDLGQLESSLAKDFNLIIADKDNEDLISHQIGQADVLLSQRLSTAHLKAAKRLKLLQVPGAGVNHLDLAALQNLQIDVANSHSAAPFVAEHAVAMLLTLMKKISTQDTNLRNGKWLKPTDFAKDEALFPDSLIGKTVGIVGFGKIGSEISKLLSGFNVNILALAKNPDVKSRSNDQKIKFVSLEKLLANVDALFLSLPLTNETNALIGKHQFSLMNKKSYLVNVGRAEVVDETELVQALTNRKIRGAALDVFQSGMASVEKFSSLDNVLLSPHCAGTDRDHSPHLNGAIASLIQYAQMGETDNSINMAKGY